MHGKTEFIARKAIIFLTFTPHWEKDKRGERAYLTFPPFSFPNVHKVREGLAKITLGLEIQPKTLPLPCERAFCSGKKMPARVGYISKTRAL